MEQIVFVDENGKPTGEIGPKLASHTATTRRHLAFSCYIFRLSDKKLLITQRALTKRVWRGVWTNSVCGHPSPGEVMEDAIKRRALFELGIKQLEGLTCVLPNYRYTTPPYNGIIENEFCPVFVAYTADSVTPNADEVAAYQWASLAEYNAMLRDQPEKMSYWAKDQYPHLKTAEAFRI